jgi:hypothetical protein
MGEVIQVDFTKKAITVPNPLWLRFVQMMADNGMCEDDILEVEDAVQDPVLYDTAEEDIRQIADVWFRNTWRS